LYLDLVDGISGFAINCKLNKGEFYFWKIPSKNKVNGKLTMLMKKGGVCVFEENLREVSVSFKT